MKHRLTLMQEVLISGLFSAIFLLASPCLASLSIDITDTTTPPSLDGTAAAWKLLPAIVLDKKEQVVSGQSEWTGPDYTSARIYITYDKDNLYIAADITSKTPMFNAQEGHDIYNGDALEVYIGTDLSDSKRASYAQTDCQLFISPGKNGENPIVYSMTDQAPVPDALATTKLVPNGYCLLSKIPLKFLYKVNVGPDKTIGFDVSLDDVGATSKVRALQLSWSQQDKSWQDPSKWGTLTFKGKATYVNTSPKQTMPGAVIGNTNPKDGANGASTVGTLIWGFNGDLGGFEGPVSQETTIISEGNGSLLIAANGSQGWNQNLGICSSIPVPDQWENFKSITLDAYFPVKSLEKASYGELYLITQSPSNSWYEIKMIAHEGWNHFKTDVDGSQFKGGITKAYLVLNSGGPIQGSVYVDNIRGVLRGAATKLLGKVQNSASKPLANAIVAIGKKSITTDSSGSFSIELPSDDYIAEVFCPGYLRYKAKIKIDSDRENKCLVTLKSINAVSKPAVIDAFFDKPKVRNINKHYFFGNNIAAWYKPEWLSDPTAQKEMASICDYIRVPGGGFSNIWNWRTGAIFRNDGVNVDWTPDTKWADMVGVIKATNSEPLLVANIMTMDVQNCLDWIADAKAQGLTVRYLELGNEPDYHPELAKNGQAQYWTVIDNYCRAYLEFAKAIKAKYPDIKLMGPCPSQVENRERKEGDPWLASQSAPWWVERFLELCGPYVDVVSIHTYPYWSNDNDANLMAKTGLWEEYIPKIREAIQRNIPDRANKIEISVSEWNSGEENSATARLVNGVFGADFLGQMALWGVNQANIWDMMTQKPGMGGGHGVIDPTGDPDHPYAPRATYWVLDLMRHHFGTTLYQAVTDKPTDLDAFASEDSGKKYIMVVNKNNDVAFSAAINLGKITKGKNRLDFYRLSSAEYQWSENLYRAVVNSGPTHLVGSKTVGSRFSASFPPCSVTCIEILPSK